MYGELPPRPADEVDLPAGRLVDVELIPPEETGGLPLSRLVATVEGQREGILDGCGLFEGKTPKGLRACSGRGPAASYRGWDPAATRDDIPSRWMRSGSRAVLFPGYYRSRHRDDCEADEESERAAPSAQERSAHLFQASGERRVG